MLRTVLVDRLNTAKSRHPVGFLDYGFQITSELYLTGH
ncbi:hypothetical protein B932_1383 [Gluconobacter oxydans H24]|nr:hypothetical protein B932_1383 [Gluconobacter oxydans H24]